jgi:hypothetical protein
MEADFKGVTAKRSEFREGGYFYEAELNILKNIWREKKSWPNTEE